MSVADRVPLDWQAIESSSTEEERSLLRCLQAIEALSLAHAHDSAVATDSSVAADPKRVMHNWRFHCAGERSMCANASAPADTVSSIARGTLLSTGRSRSNCFAPSRSPASSDSSRIIEEGRMMARIRHPNVVAILRCPAHRRPDRAVDGIHPRPHASP